MGGGRKKNRGSDTGSQGSSTPKKPAQAEGASSAKKHSQAEGASTPKKLAQAEGTSSAKKPAQTELASSPKRPAQPEGASSTKKPAQSEGTSVTKKGAQPEGTSNNVKPAPTQDASSNVKPVSAQKGGDVSKNRGKRNSSPKTLSNVNSVTQGVAKMKIEEGTETPKNHPPQVNNVAESEGTSSQVADETPKSKEEIMAERKAKAAEAKARKAAAVAAKKAANANKPEGAKNTASKQPKKEHAKEGAQEKAQNNEQANGSPAQRGSMDQGKVPLTSGSSRLPTPFRHVHFDMTPFRNEERVQRQPSGDGSNENVHPAFLDFAARCSSGHVVGIDAVCVAFVHAFKEFLMVYSVDGSRAMSHDLDEMAGEQIKFLTENKSQPLPLALENVVRQLRKEINQLPKDVPEITGKETLLEWLEDFVNQNFDLAFRQISSFCYDKLVNTPYVVTYSWCPVVERIILDAYEKGLAFHVCVIDSPTVQRGKQLAKKLSAKNIECTYGMLNAVGYVMKQANMVLLGCSAILSNGYVVADRGSSQVALVASAVNVPVLVAAQTFKFVDRVQLFDRGQRERNVLVEEQKETIPADLVTAVVTELRILHPSSAPAVLKAKQLAVG